MSKPNTLKTPPARGSGCPLCGKPSNAVAAPFCGPGCRDRDLLNWLGEGYRAPGPPIEAGELASLSGGLDSGG